MLIFWVYTPRTRKLEVLVNWKASPTSYFLIP